MTPHLHNYIFYILLQNAVLGQVTLTFTNGYLATKPEPCTNVHKHLHLQKKNSAKNHLTKSKTPPQHFIKITKLNLYWLSWQKELILNVFRKVCIFFILCRWLGPNFIFIQSFWYYCDTFMFLNKVGNFN
jgi:hypothetical protein